MISGINKNNNKFEAGDQTQDSLQEIESLKTQLHQMATEKSSLALKLGEQKGQIHSLLHQIENLKVSKKLTCFGVTMSDMCIGVRTEPCGTPVIF